MKAPTRPADPHVNGDGDLVLTSEAPPDPVKVRGAELMAWWCRQFPEMSRELSPQMRGRYAGVLLQLCHELRPRAVRALCLGIVRKFPYAPKPNGDPGEPFTPFDMKNHAAKCIEFGLRELAKRKRLEHANAKRKANPPPVPTAPDTPASRAAAREFLADFEERTGRSFGGGKVEI